MEQGADAEKHRRPYPEAGQYADTHVVWPSVRRSVLYARLGRKSGHCRNEVLHSEKDPVGRWQRYLAVDMLHVHHVKDRT